MKINARKPSHWLYIALFTLTVLTAVIARRLRLVKADKTCLLYGHKLNGNLKAIFDFNERNSNAGIDMYFVSMDVPYCSELSSAGVPVISGANVFNALKLASAFAVISDHGLHSLVFMLRFTDTRFFDAGHAITIKGFDEQDYGLQKEYEQVWVSSVMLRQVHIDKFGLPSAAVHATGFPRTDILVNRDISIEAIRKKFAIEDDGKRIFMFAPTWKQDDENRSIVPFGESDESFVQLLEDVCHKTNSLCVFRTHLNSGEAPKTHSGNILFRPHSEYPDTEELLLIVDCLITDWSSIGFDFLLLDRPMIYLDVPHPFAKGLSISPRYRCGRHVSNSVELVSALEEYLFEPEAYLREFAALHSETRRALYDDNADGHSAERICRILAGFT